MAVIGSEKGVGEASQSLDTAESSVVSLDVLVPALQIAAGAMGV